VGLRLAWWCLLGRVAGCFGVVLVVVLEMFELGIVVAVVEGAVVEEVVVAAVEVEIVVVAVEVDLVVEGEDLVEV